MIGSHRLVNNVPPFAALECPHRREDVDLAVLDQLPGGHPAEAVVEIDVAARMENLLNHRQAGGMVEPSAAVHEGNAAHPIGMVVDHEKIERPANSANEG